MKEALDYLQNYQWGNDRKKLNPIDEAIVASHGDEAARKEIESKLVGVLKSKASRNGKDYVCRKLKVIGTDACVGALASMLGDSNHSHMARFALQSIPGEAATKALVEALEKTKGDLKIGVVGSLGARGDDMAVEAIAKLVNDADAKIAKSAACALGAIQSEAAATALKAAKPTADVMDATLACAEGMLASGNKLGALAIYKSLGSGEAAKHIKLAAKRGMLACASQ